MFDQLLPFAMQHVDFLEGELATAPQGGPWFCGANLTAVDILLSFPLMAGRKRLSIQQDKYPRISKFLDLIEANDAWKRSVKRVEEVEGKPMGDLSM